MGRKLFLILLAVVATTAGAAGKKPVVSKKSARKPAVQSIKAEYSNEMKPLFFYTEGIKQAKVFGDTKLAVGLFDKAIALDSTHAPSYYQAAATLIFSDSPRAMQYSIKANSLDTANVWYKSQLARLYVINNEYTKAKDIYEKLVDISPRNPENYSMLAALYQYAGQPYTAIAVLDKAESVLGKQEELVAYKREMLVKLRLFDRAIEETRDMINNYPYNYENYLAIADLYAQTRQDSLAMANYNTAMRLDPDNIEVLSALNDYYHSKGDNINHLAIVRRLMASDEITAEAKVKYIRDLVRNRNYYRENYYSIRDVANVLLAKYPANDEVFFLATETIAASGDMEEALKLYKERISDTTTNRKLFTDIIEMETYLERNDSVNKYTALAIERFPRDSDLYMRQGGVLFYLKRYDEAIHSFSKAYKYASGDSVRSAAIGTIGDLYHQQGKEKKSYESYRKALKLNPDNILVLNNYAYYLSVQGKDLENALAMAQRVMELEPGIPTYIDTYGWILYKLGRYEEAKKAIQQAIALDTRGSSELYLHYGDILYAMGDHYMATVYWERALKAGHNEKEVKKRLEKAAK